MDWFRRQRRAKKVTNEEDAPALPAPEDASLEEASMALPVSPPIPTPPGLPQPLLVELTPAPSPAALLDIPQPFKVEVAPGPEKPEKPDVKGILAAEFNYIAETTIQNSEDRVSGFFFVSAAAVVSAAVGLKFDTSTPSWLYTAFSAIFIVLAGLGWMAILQLAQLRRSWFSSIRAMNRIKSYYYHTFPAAADFVSPPPDQGIPHPGVATQNTDKGVFYWMKEPARFKVDSVAFMRCCTVALIDLLFVASAIVLFYVAQNPEVVKQGAAMTPPLVTGGLIGLLVLSLQLYSYVYLVQRD